MRKNVRRLILFGCLMCYMALVIRFLVFKHWGVVAFAVGIPVLTALVLAYRAKLRCPKCRITWAMRKTGKSENRGGRFLKDWREEWTVSR